MYDGSSDTEKPRNNLRSSVDLILISSTSSSTSSSPPPVPLLFFSLLSNTNLLRDNGRSRRKPSSTSHPLLPVPLLFFFFLSDTNLLRDGSSRREPLQRSDPRSRFLLRLPVPACIIRPAPPTPKPHGSSLSETLWCLIAHQLSVAQS